MDDDDDDTDFCSIVGLLLSIEFCFVVVVNELMFLIVVELLLLLLLSLKNNFGNDRIHSIASILYCAVSFSN
jgi:hypothetical protein